MTYLSSDAIVRISNGASVVISASATRYTPSIVLDLLDNVILSEIVPHINKSYEEYYLAYTDIAVTANQINYLIPSRAYLNKIHSVYWLNSSKTSKKYLHYRSIRDMGLTSNGEPAYHNFKGDSLVIAPIPSSTGYLRVYYYYTPNNLVYPDEAMLVEAINPSLGAFSGDCCDDWAVDEVFDIISYDSPFGFININLVATATNPGTAITFDADDLDIPKINATNTLYIARTGQTPILQIPKSLHYLACDLVICLIRDQLGDEGFVQKYQTNLRKIPNILSDMQNRKATELPPIQSKNSAFDLLF